MREGGSESSELESVKAGARELEVNERSSIELRAEDNGELPSAFVQAA